MKMATWKKFGRRKGVADEYSDAGRLDWRRRSGVDRFGAPCDAEKAAILARRSESLDGSCAGTDLGSGHQEVDPAAFISSEAGLGVRQRPRASPANGARD